jgi:hypothetical protein
MLAVFAAFAREYFTKIRDETRKQEQFPFELRQPSADDGIFSELESRRKIVATQRKKRAQENKTHSQKAQTAQS